MNKPAISGLMSVYNGEKYIAESIDSILNQTYQNFELVIIDDGSTDSTYDIIKSYNDSRIQLYRLEENVGVGKALNFGLSKIQGYYTAHFDADDIYYPERLQKQKDYLDKHPDITLLSSFVTYFPDNVEVAASLRYRSMKSRSEKRKKLFISWKDIQEKIYWYCCITHSSMMIRSEIIKKFGYSDYRMGEDYKLFYDLNKNGYKIVNMPEVLAKIRVSSGSITATHSDLAFKTLYLIKKEEINKLFNDQERVMLWGAGEFGKNFLEVLNENGLDVEGFIDSDLKKKGLIVKGKTVFTPDILSKNKDIKVLVVSDPGRLTIANYLKEIGFKHKEDFIVC